MRFAAMSGLKGLAKETMIYGLSYSAGRLLNFLLVTVYLTRVFTEERAYFSIYSELYFFIALFLGILGLRMETGFFRFASDEAFTTKIYPLASQLVWLVCGVFLITIFLGLDAINEWLRYPGLQNLIFLATVITILDVCSALPFAKLRYDKRPLRYAWIKLSGLILNILLVLFLLQEFGGTAADKLYWVMLANLAGSALTLVLLLPEMKTAFTRADWGICSRLVRYVSPLIIVTLSFIVIQYGATSVLKYFLPGSALQNLETSSSFNAAMRLAVIMNLFVTAFNYAAEPFFFRHAKKDHAPVLFARLSLYFIIACCFIYLAVGLYIDLFALLLDKNFRNELFLVNILLLANIFMGLYSNFSSWYKLSDHNRMMALVSVSGMLLMLTLNIFLIPFMGNGSAALANLLAYLFICVMAYYQGQKKYPIPYPILKMSLWLVCTILTVVSIPVLYRLFALDANLQYGISFVCLAVYIFAVYKLEYKKS